MKPKRTILLVDDSEIDRSITKFLLDTWGYTVIPVSSSEALTRFAKGGIDLVLAKVEPESTDSLDGIKLVKAMKQMFHLTPVILFSRTIRGWSEINHQANRFLPKGFSNADLLEVIRLLLVRKRGPKPKWIREMYERAA